MNPVTMILMLIRAANRADEKSDASIGQTFFLLVVGFAIVSGALGAGIYLCELMMK